MTFKSYKEAIEYIFSLRKPRQNYTPGIHLERLKTFLDFVDNPQNDYKIIHVGGTSGKGSVTYITSKILIGHALKVGTHTSPHMFSINDKFQINLQNIENEELVLLTDWLKNALQSFFNKYQIEISYYEAIVAMVFKHFSINKVDVAVIEVGLGGKLDATNVVNSEIAILTNVGLDHMEILGNTKEEILLDKVEIMKPNKSFITAVREVNLIQIIKNKAKQKKNHLYIFDEEFKASEGQSFESYSTFTFSNQEIEIKNIELGLSGIFQIENASLAIQASYLFLENKLDSSKLISTLKELNFPGRMQLISKNPLIIFDGAHNESKMRALSHTLRNLYPDKKLKILLSFKKGKNLDLIIKEMVNMNISEIVITEFEWEYYDKLVSFSSEEIKIELENYIKTINIDIVKDPYEAYKIAKHEIQNDEMLLVTGSLYLLGTLFQKLNNA
ncbi:hypothetical protein KBD45_00755 [Candidatus Dojkabacteria bacterium]|nr:hypothetical protein [Candidatus Dojkabacteria bacterium]